MTLATLKSLIDSYHNEACEEKGINPESVHVSFDIGNNHEIDISQVMMVNNEIILK